MRWKNLNPHEMHWAHWLWLWAPAFVLAVVVCISIVVDWLIERKRAVIGPSVIWKKWFAWHPVDVTGAESAWLEQIERRIDPFDGTIIYRFPRER